MEEKPLLHIPKENNVVIIQGFEEYCALLLFKGVLLKIPTAFSSRQTENMQAARHPVYQRARNR